MVMLESAAVASLPIVAAHSASRSVTPTFTTVRELSAEMHSSRWSLKYLQVVQFQHVPDVVPVASLKSVVTLAVTLTCQWSSVVPVSILTGLKHYAMRSSHRLARVYSVGEAFELGGGGDDPEISAWSLVSQKSRHSASRNRYIIAHGRRAKTQLEEVLLERPPVDGVLVDHDGFVPPEVVQEGRQDGSLSQMHDNKCILFTGQHFAYSRWEVVGFFFVSFLYFQTTVVAQGSTMGLE